jgi:hypothetical protein
VSAVAVLHVGGVDLDGEKSSVGIGQGVALAPPDLLRGVEAAWPPFRSAVRTDWLSSTAAVGLSLLDRPARGRG